MREVLIRTNCNVAFEKLLAGSVQWLPVLGESRPSPMVFDGLQAFETADKLAGFFSESAGAMR